MAGATEREETLRFDPLTGSIAGRAPTSRYLADVGASFADRQAYTQVVATNPLVYQVTHVEDHSGDGQIHYGIGIIFPGKVGREYFTTKSHLHGWRPAAGGCDGQRVR